MSDAKRGNDGLCFEKEVQKLLTFRLSVNELYVPPFPFPNLYYIYIKEEIRGEGVRVRFFFFDMTRQRISTRRSAVLTQISWLSRVPLGHFYVF